MDRCELLILPLSYKALLQLPSTVKLLQGWDRILKNSNETQLATGKGLL